MLHKEQAACLFHLRNRRVSENPSIPLKPVLKSVCTETFEMSELSISGRQLKKRIMQLLLGEDFLDKGLDEIRRLPPRRTVNPLFSFLFSLDDRVKWRTVTAMGKVVADLAASDLESARVVMRRFIWNLNDESGGIGWGCPESMAEAMAQNERLAEEYSCILISYIQPEGNYLEHEGLQRGVLWGVGRLAHTRPCYTRNTAAYLRPYMVSEDPLLRGLAVWAVTPSASATETDRLKQLLNDSSKLMLYCNGYFSQYSVGQLALDALTTIKKNSNFYEEILG
jgi:hypothetical protein